MEAQLLPLRSHSGVRSQKRPSPITHPYASSISAPAVLQGTYNFRHYPIYLFSGAFSLSSSQNVRSKSWPSPLHSSDPHFQNSTKSKASSQKMAKRCTLTFHQRGHRGGEQAHEEMSNITAIREMQVKTIVNRHSCLSGRLRQKTRNRDSTKYEQQCRETVSFTHG